MALRRLPSREYLLERLHYDEGDGNLYWHFRPRLHFKSDAEARRWNTRYAGTLAGSITRPHAPRRQVTIDARDYFAHHIVWKIITGDDAPELDHKDRNGLNNKFENLRSATRAQNTFNRKRTRRNGLPKGVWRRGSRFYASIGANQKRYFLGAFGSCEDAVAAYNKAAERLHGEYACVNAHG